MIDVGHSLGNKFNRVIAEEFADQPIEVSKVIAAAAAILGAYLGHADLPMEKRLVAFDAVVAQMRQMVISGEHYPETMQ